MTWHWHKILLGLKVAEQIAVAAGQAGVTIKGRNPAEVDAAARAAAQAVVAALRTPAGPRPIPPAA